MEAIKARLGYQPNFYYFRAFIAGATALWLVAFSSDAPAQSEPRPFQMSILASTDNVYNAGVDIPIFTRNENSNYQDQPEGSSIAWVGIDPNLDKHNINWRRIVAVYVDEPYGKMLENKNSCDPIDPNDPNYPNTIGPMMAKLEAMAAALRIKAPRARFWVNFTKHEIDLILKPAANCPLNQPYIDVISMDWYGLDFAPAVKMYYQNLYGNRATAHQQLALVPGTFTGGYEQQSGDQGAWRLSGYFEYANTMNQSCNLPLGPAGKTGYYDGCPVWMVAGWMGGVTPPPGASNYYPIDNPASIKVFNRWQQQFAVPPAPKPVSPMRKLMPLLFEQ
jgi:hypothetical protein